MIHHYTSIQTLALILKFKKLRFTRLDLVDDIKEIAGFSQSFGTYVFISCWTEEERENIALWKMYTNNMQGVRISLPQQMFNDFKYEPGDYDGYKVTGDNITSPIPLKDSMGDNYIIHIPKVVDFFYKSISYDDDYEEKYSKLFKTEPGRIRVEGIQHLGKYKDTMWEFQKESRFAIYMFPLLPLNSPEINGDKRKQFDSAGSSIANGVSNTIEFFDVSLNENVLNNIIVRLGPLGQYADKLLVETLLKEYTTNGKLEDSHLKGVIRK